MTDSLIPPPPSMQEFVDTLCASDPLHARTRLMLLKMERSGHRLGWDNRNFMRIFQVEYHPGKKQVKCVDRCPLTDVLDYGCIHNGGDVGYGFQFLADHTENVEAGRFDHLTPPGLREALTRRTADGDLWEGSEPSWKFYGYGFAHEAWRAPIDDGMDCEPKDHPDRVEARAVWLAARDGLFWTAVRNRGGEPFVSVYLPEKVTGRVPNAMSRLTKLVAGNPVPVIPLALRRPSKG